MPVRHLALAVAALLLPGCLSADGDGGPDAGGEPCPTSPTSVGQDIRVPNLAGGGRLGDTDVHAVPLDLASLVPAGFRWGCVRAVEVVLAWANSPTAGADLYVGLEVPATGLRVVGQDRQQTVADGAHSESVLAAVGWGPHDPAALADGITILVLSDWASLSQNGLDATVTVSLLG